MGSGQEAARPSQIERGRKRASHPPSDSQGRAGRTCTRSSRGPGSEWKEVRQLVVSDLRLDAIVPGIDLRPDVRRAGKVRSFPCADLAEIIRRQIAGRKPAALVFEVPADLIKRFHADCKRAGIPRFDERGYRVVLHSLTQRRSALSWQGPGCR